MPVITIAHTDSVRIESPDGSVVQIPAAAILAADRVLRHCLGETDGKLTVGPRIDDTVGWVACVHARQRFSHGFAPTPWGAIIALAEAIEGAK